MHQRTGTGWAKVASTVTLLGLLAAACSSASGSEAVGDVAQTTSASPPPTSRDDAVPEAAELSAVAFGATTAAPLERVELDVPQGLDVDALGVVLRTGADAGDIAVPLYVDDAGGGHISLPFNPRDPFADGELELYVTDGEERGPITVIGVSGLVEAPGAWNDFVADFAAAIDRDARELGSSFDDLAATSFEQVAPVLIPLKLAQDYVDDGSTSDLESLYDNPLFDDDDRRLIDALTARIDLSAMLDRAGPHGLMSLRSVPAPAVPRPPRRTTPLLPRQSGCIDAGIEIADAADLSHKMNAAFDATITAGGAEATVLEGIGTVTTVGGFLPVVGPAVSAFGAGFASLEAYKNGIASLYPSQLTELRGDVSQPRFPEDFVAPGSWSRVEVRANSTAWQADADVGRALLASLSTITSAVAGLGKTSVADVVALNTSNLVRDNAANGAIEANAQDGGVLTFCADVWTVDITGEPWSTGRAVLERFAVRSDAREFEPIEAGLPLPIEDTLRLQANPDRFAGQDPFEDTEIVALPIILDPVDEVEVEQPGDDVVIEATIINAHDSELSWEAAFGGWRGDARITAAGGVVDDPTVWERTHVSSSSEDDFPYLVTLEPVTRSGLRADNSPPIVRTVEVKLKELIVTPEDGRVLVGGSLRYEARDRDGNLVDVDWTATGGAIDATGTYTAGERPGTYTVTATAQDDPQLTDTVSVEVVEADCVVGDWRLREQEFLDQIAAVTGGGASATHIGGRYLVTLTADGEYVGRRDGWQFVFDTPQGALDVSIDSTETGTWVVDTEEEQLFVDEQTSNATVSVTVGGVQVSHQINAPGFGGQGPYVCDGDVLTVTTDGITVTLDRIG